MFYLYTHTHTCTRICPGKPEVRDGGFDLLGVFWRERHAPKWLAGHLK